MSDEKKPLNEPFPAKETAVRSDSLGGINWANPNGEEILMRGLFGIHEMDPLGPRMITMPVILASAVPVLHPAPAPEPPKDPKK